MGKTTPKAPSNGLGNQRLKGENFYHDRKKVAYLNMLKTGRPKRNAQGKIVKAAAYQSKLTDPVARVLPNRKWFGNTRVIGQAALEDFRTKLMEKVNDPYQVLMRTNKLPMSLIQTNESDTVKKARILDTSGFDTTFGPKAQRKKPVLSVDSIEKLAKNVDDNLDGYEETKDKNLLSNQQSDYVDVTRDWYFGAGMSKRIWNELYKVIDSSDVVVHVLDARDPLGTRCVHVEKYLQKEAPHKHLIYVLNKVDLVPNWVTARYVKLLSRERPTIAFHASITNSFGKGTLIQLLRQFSKLHSDKKQISVGFIGYPNTGKSSIINTLRKKKVCTVAPLPGETKVWQYITLMRRIYLIDCPGIVQSSVNDTETDIVLKGSIRTNNLESPEDYIDEIINRRVKKEYISKTYNIDNWDDHIDFLTHFAQLTGKLNKGGEPDLHVVSIMVINDFLRGKLPHFKEPPAKIQNPMGNDENPNGIEDANNLKSEAKEENESENTRYAINQEFNKIPVLADYYQYDLVNKEYEEELAEERLKEKEELDKQNEINGDNVANSNDGKDKKKRRRDQKKADNKEAPKILVTKETNSGEQFVSEEPDWDAVFSNVVGEEIPFYDLNKNGDNSDSEKTKNKKEKVQEKYDSELESEVEDSESEEDENSKSKRMTTRKLTKTKNFYQTGNTKNKSRKAKSTNESVDQKIKKLRKPGSWKVAPKK
ncbi:hypothetical protein BB559_003967 [Furculomyces boomerangus]|uniref:Nucleolar GTP-binding protein 2 n=1 Tax=Furculomyces boomerangus TaxID=61424 RepID=A0A2T9YHK3_9FUNG|nr:hypothetical protein BB559_003967 [Furculomyces boomerangus]